METIKISLLTTREVKVLHWLARGYTKVEVGKQLNISSYTVDYHARNIMAKLEARNITAAVYIAMSLGVLDPL